jgi:hypothetical protein
MEGSDIAPAILSLSAHGAGTSVVLVPDLACLGEAARASGHDQLERVLCAILQRQQHTTLLEAAPGCLLWAGHDGQVGKLAEFGRALGMRRTTQ